jgi:hypothetical protein
MEQRGPSVRLSEERRGSPDPAGRGRNGLSILYLVVFPFSRSVHLSRARVCVCSSSLFPLPSSLPPVCGAWDHPPDALRRHSVR